MTQDDPKKKKKKREPEMFSLAERAQTPRGQEIINFMTSVYGVNPVIMSDSISGRGEFRSYPEPTIRLRDYLGDVGPMYSPNQLEYPLAHEFSHARYQDDHPFKYEVKNLFAGLQEWANDKLGTRMVPSLERDAEIDAMAHMVAKRVNEAKTLEGAMQSLPIHVRDAAPQGYKVRVHPSEIYDSLNRLVRRNAYNGSMIRRAMMASGRYDFE